MVDSNSQIDFYPHVNIETVTILCICAKTCPKHAILFLIAFFHFEHGYFSSKNANTLTLKHILLFILIKL